VKSNKVLVVILGTDCDATRAIFHALTKEFAEDQVDCRVVLENAVPKWILLKNRLKKMPATRVLGQILFQAVIVPVLRLVARKRVTLIRNKTELCFNDIPSERVTLVSSINDSKAIEAIRSKPVDVVVVSGTRILSQAVLSASTAPFLNLHAGITPLYRGVHGGYWALANHDHQSFGVTLHRVDAGIDTGAILSQARFEPEAEDSFVSYPLLQLSKGIPLLKNALRQIIVGEPLKSQAPPAGPSRLWSHPTFSEYLKNRILHGIK
jgi:formyltetrahydrofolate hydrolase